MRKTKPGQGRATPAPTPADMEEGDRASLAGLTALFLAANVFIMGHPFDDEPVRDEAAAHDLIGEAGGMLASVGLATMPLSSSQAVAAMGVSPPGCPLLGLGVTTASLTQPDRVVVRLSQMVRLSRAPEVEIAVPTWQITGICALGEWRETASALLRDFVCAYLSANPQVHSRPAAPARGFPGIGRG